MTLDFRKLLHYHTVQWGEEAQHAHIIQNLNISDPDPSSKFLINHGLILLLVAYHLGKPGYSLLYFLKFYLLVKSQLFHIVVKMVNFFTST